MFRYADSFTTYKRADAAQRYSVFDAGNSLMPVAAAAGVLPILPGGGMYVQGANNANEKLRWIADAQATWVVGAVFYPGVATANVLLMRILDSLGNEQCSVRTNGSSQIIFSRNGTVVGSPGASIAAIGAWFHLELKVTVHNSAGALEIRLNGSPTVGPLTSQNTRGQSENSGSMVSFLTAASNNWAFSRLTIYDGQGAVNNDFAGPCRVIPVKLVAAGNSSDWTPAGFSENHECVNDAMSDDDASYIESATPGDVDLYTTTGVPTGTIKGVQVVITGKYQGAARVVRPVWRIGSTDYPGSNIALPTSHAQQFQVFDVSPASTAAWTDAELDAAELGVELVS